MRRSQFALIIVSALVASTFSVSVASATSTITRTLPTGNTLYSVSCANEVPNGQLARVAVSTGIQTKIGTGTTDPYSGNFSPGQTGCAVGATYNQVTNTAFWVNLRYGEPGIFPGVTSRIFKIDVTTGNSTYVGHLTPGLNVNGAGASGQIKVYGIAVGASGNMYAFWAGNTDGHYYVGLVNQSDASISAVLQLNSSYDSYFNSEGMWNFAYNPTDHKFYTAGQGSRATTSFTHLYSIDVTSGSVTDIGPSGSLYASFNGLAFDSSGAVLWGANYDFYTATLSGWSSPGDLQNIPGPMPPYYTEALFIVPPTSDDSAAKAAATAKAAADAAAAAKAKQDQDITAIVSSIVGAVGAITSGVVGLAATVEKNRRTPATSQKVIKKKLKKKAKTKK